METVQSTQPEVSVVQTYAQKPGSKIKKIAILAVAAVLFAVIAGIFLFLQSKVSSECGNGLVETGEQCDDGNKLNGDNCSNQCLSEITEVGSTTFDDQCTNIKYYKVIGEVSDANNWQLLASNELENLQAGDLLYITALSTSISTDSASRARIRSSIDKEVIQLFSENNETTQIKPKSDATLADEYYILFTVPDLKAESAIHFDAQLYYPKLDSNDNPSDGDEGWR